MTSLKDPTAFFNYLRKGSVLGPELDAREVSGCNEDLAACGNAGWPIGWTAYALATDYHETAGTMTPIKEYGSAKYHETNYGPQGRRPIYAKKMGNVNVGDGVKYAGRGRVQLTWHINYKKAGDKLGVDLVNHPDLALDLTIASKIMIMGMGEGWFTGVRCASFMPKEGLATREQFRKARAIINGTDQAVKIAGYAVHFQDALKAGGWS